ncbi:MAG: hypothetical protein ACI80M_000476 [Gammaproteobacteria bacterium]|jgi:hypothetical protein|tara:strand:- start:143 stop:385 length:243 start_codon:yes stop_codon:yes gene_type:complete
MSSNRLKPEDIDKLGDALIALTHEVWVLRDRQKVLERLLADAGVLAPDAVQGFQPDDSLNAELSAEREALINNVLGALSA